MEEPTDRMHHDEQLVQQATQMTATNLRKLMAETTSHKGNTSHISVPEREELIELISQILPAGNVVGFVYNGIMHVKDRAVPPTEGRTHFSSLLKGLAIVRDNAFYRMMFAGPATVLVGYNMLLRLAGASPDQFLPEGIWQFYVEFGLREDGARHNNETMAFQQIARTLRPALSEAEELTAWVLSAMWLLRDYDYLLANLWEEHVRLTAIEEATGLTRLHRMWQPLRPFSVPADQPALTLPVYRRQRFDAFCDAQLEQVGRDQVRHFERLWLHPENQTARAAALQSFQRQLSIRAYLDPGEASERRVPIRNSDLRVGIVYRDTYYLLSLTDPTNPIAPALIYSQVSTILAGKSAPSSNVDRMLALTSRVLQPILLQQLSKDDQAALRELRKAPIIINWDATASNRPLSLIRQSRHGIGDHALSLLRTHNSMVFDFSHIYFDGPWAMEAAELVTNEAVRALTRREAMRTPISNSPAPTRIQLGSSPRFEKAASKLPHSINHISGEASLPLASLTELRKLLFSRTKPTIHLTINDLLVLFRTAFNQRYRPSSRLDRALNDLRRKAETRSLVTAVDAMLNGMRDVNPSLMIPIDAMRVNPRDRLFPSTFRSPFPDFLRKHNEILSLQQNANRAFFKKDDALNTFLAARQEYLSTLSTFSDVMRRYREIALKGESMSATAIRLIAGLPGAMQRLMDGLPGHFSFMNEAIKGEEVFSNVGQVTPGSSISRFSSAKDDNDKKVLVWGIMTDNNNILCITLRDFRPPVLALAQAGYDSVAQLVAQDFVESYVADLQTFVSEMKTIIAAPRT